MIHNFPLKWQVPLLCGFLALSCAPSVILLARKADEEKATVEASLKKDASTVADIKEALSRAERCILIDPKYPLVEGGNAYYDIKSKEKRLLPTGTVLCSPRSGNTAIVDASGSISDIKSAPVEQVTRTLKQRGLI